MQDTTTQPARQTPPVRRTEAERADEPRAAQTLPADPDDPTVVPRDVPLTSIVVEDIGPPTPETGVADVLLGSIALVGALLIASLVLGGFVGAALVYVKHRLGYGGPEVDEREHVRLAIGRDEPPR